MRLPSPPSTVPLAETLPDAELNQLTGIAAILTYPLDIEVVEEEERAEREEEAKRRREAGEEQDDE